MAFTIYTTDLLMTVFSRSNRVLPSRLNSGISKDCGTSSILRRVTSLFTDVSTSVHCSKWIMNWETCNKVDVAV